MAGISTHMLDNLTGWPGVGMRIDFSVFDTKQHYHVPMLCTPWRCATYRGS